jgi:hypothetical protein
MVWARTKLMIHDDLLKPLPRMKINFVGSNPEKFCKEIYDMLLATFRVSEHSIQEKEFQVVKGDPEKFKIKWEVNKDLDKFSYYWIAVELSGEVSKGHGKADITIEGALRTEYPQDTFWQRSLLYEFLRMIWHSTFYSSERDEYLREGRVLLSLFINQLKILTRC